MRISIYLTSILTLALLTYACRQSAREQQQEKAVQSYSLNLDDLQIRDPFILANEEDSTYYLHVNSGKRSILCYKSRDLRMWSLCGESFRPDSNFWGKNNFWAPDLYKYKGKYYLFVTFSSEEVRRGVSILVSDYPDRDFRPLVNRAVTPVEWMCLDGSLFVDKDGLPWVLYCREWVEVNDGEIYAQRLSEDLTHAIDTPLLLFRGSLANWTGLISSGARTGIVTNSPFIYTAVDGKLLMIWSSFRKNGEYAIGLAVSESGKLTGPWVHSPESLNDDGGHAMLFRDFKGRLVMSYHTNEQPERVVLRPVYLEGERLLFLN